MVKNNVTAEENDDLMNFGSNTCNAHELVCLDRSTS